MTQAFNLSQFANKVNTSGQASLTTGVTGTLPVANGGTNQTTYTNGQLLIGNTTGNTLTKATLTAGSNISITNGAGSITIASTAAGGGFSNMQVFASPGTFTTPASTTQIKITVVGGGGGGGASFSGARPGGASGGYAVYVGPVTASNPYPVTVGSGGSGGTGAGSGSSGNTSSFGSLASATGGSGGSGQTAPTPPPYQGGTGTAGTLLISGTAISPTQVGAASLLSGAAPTFTSPLAGLNYGGGGTGGGGPGNGTSGGGGVVIVEY